MQEIERKYLLKDSILSLIEKNNLKADKITQYYTTITPMKGVRYRRMGDRYFKTVKHGTGAAREEVEVEISKPEFQKNLRDRIKSDIRKNRYLFHFEGYAYSIDVFKKALKGFYILEIEFPNMKAFEAFTLPDILKTHVIKEVSFDESYKNKNIVLHGRPPTSYQMDSLFKALERKSIDALDHYFIPNLTPIDALRLILYKFSLNILTYKERLLLHNEIEDLHQFRVNIRKSRAFLKEFGFLIPKKYLTYFNQHLEDFATQTNQKRDLDVIQARLNTLGKEHKMIKKDIRHKSEYEQHTIEKMLKSKSFEDFFETYGDILTKETLLTSDNGTGSIEKSAKQVITYLHHKIVKKIIILEKDFDAQKLHKIRISLKKLRYILEELQHIYGEEKIEKMIDKGKKLQTLLGDYNDAVNQQKLLHDYFKQNKKKISDHKQLEHTLLETTIQVQETLIIHAKKQLHTFKNEPFKL
ncbi:MAG: CHAD domain-containing protein [Campylobacterota bacterium]|nr:CHAD domain-containing protein [Campylobacterota bacterium]